MKRRFLCATLLLLVASLATADEIPSANNIRAELVTDDLEHPVQILSAPGEQARLYVAERGGVVRILQNGKLISEELLDLSAVVHKKHPHGLLGIAFAPDYQTSRLFYAAYIDRQGDVNVGRFRHSGEDTADEDSMTVIIKLAQAFPNTNAAALGFGPDGYLYIAWGDGGGPDEMARNSQNLSSVFGKIFRIKVSDESAYTTPPDNPFRSYPKALPEIWALGFQNPLHLAFDNASGAMVLIDQGSKTNELNLVERGKNYGWNQMEGSTCHQTPCNTDTFTSPFLTTPANQRLVGGLLYRGSLFQNLSGHYLFADASSGTINSVMPARGATTPRPIFQLPGKQLAAIGASAAGEPYVATHSGELFAIRPEKQ